MSQQTPWSDGPDKEQSFQNTENQMPAPFHWQMNVLPYPYNFFNPFYNFNYPPFGYNFNDASSMTPGGPIQPPTTLSNDRQLEYTTAMSDPFASTSSPLAYQTEAERLPQNSRSAVLGTRKNADGGQALVEMSRCSGIENHNKNLGPRISGMENTPVGNGAPRLDINHASSDPSPSALLPQLRQKAKESIVRHKHGAATKTQNAVSTTTNEPTPRIPSPFMERTKQATIVCEANQPLRKGHAKPSNGKPDLTGGQQKGDLNKASAQILNDEELPSDAEITAEWSSACQDLEDLLAEGRAGAAANVGDTPTGTSKDMDPCRPSHCVTRTRGCSAESGEIESTTAESDFPSAKGSHEQNGLRSSASDDGGVFLGAQHPKISLGCQSDIKGKGHGNADAQIQRELVDFLGSGMVENRGEKKKDVQTVSLNSEEVREWLEITGFYHTAYRQKTLDHCRDLKELEEVKERLLKGAATEPPPKALVKMPLALTLSLPTTRKQVSGTVFKSDPFVAGTKRVNETLPPKPPLVASTRRVNEPLPPSPLVVGGMDTRGPTPKMTTLNVSPSSSRRNRLRGGRRRGDNKVTQHAESLLKRSRAEMDWETTEESRKKIARTEDPKSRDSKQTTPAPTRIPTSPASASRRAWASSRVYDSYHPAGERRRIASPSGHRDSRRREDADLFDQPGRRHDNRDDRSSRLERDRSADRQGKETRSSKDLSPWGFRRRRSRSRSERNSSGKGLGRKYSEDRP